ncbi:T9SS type A sorting domain-containing protein [Polaribacter sp.]|uniref:T9SS type A sorting domain-containing protein n=1 Tax=Polaribacter sp. TaxID=1920175 RepID=UPI003F6D25C5
MKKNYWSNALYLSLFALFFWSCQQNETKNILNQTDKNYKNFKGYKETPKKTKKEADRKKGIEKIADYQRIIRKGINEEKSSYKEGYLIEEYNKAKVNKLARKSKSVLNPIFTERGPNNVPGRSRGIAIDPTNSNRWFIATVGGGLWLTEDAGSTWASITENKIPNLATSTVVISQTNPNVLYVGTGEPFGNLGAIGGSGVFKTIDGGTTWQSLSATSFYGDVGRMIINQSDDNSVVIGTTKGIYKTVNGGTSWIQTYSGGNVQDLDVDPTNFNNQYGSVNGVGIVKSTDAGETWTLAFDTADVNTSHARFEMDVSEVNPSILYVCAYSGSGGTVSTNTDLYVSKNSGATFTNLKATASAIDDRLDLVAGQGWYDNIVLAHPFNENIFYVGGVELFKVTISDNNTFEAVEMAATQQNSNLNQLNTNVHVDQHGLKSIKGANNQFQLLLTNDGGVNLSNLSTDPGVNRGDWTDAVKGKNSTQFYGATKQNGFDNYLAGAQDNGCWISLNNDATKDKEYIDVWGGDGFEVIWHYDRPGDFLVSSQNNVIGRYVNNAYAGFSRVSQSPIFYTKLSNSDSNPDVVFSVSESGVHRSQDFGENWESINMGSNFSPGSTSAFNVKVSKADANIVWAGAAMTESGSFVLKVSEDNGLTFNSAGTYDNPRGDHNFFISGIATSYTERNRAYALFSSNLAPKILKTEDLGKTWEDISGFASGGLLNLSGFPNVAVHSVLEMPFNKDIIWAGTDIGIFQTENGGANWSIISDFPSVATYDMKIVNDQIVIATYGRGIWSATIPELNSFTPAKYLALPEISTGQDIENGNTLITYKIISDDVSKAKIFIDDVEQEEIIQNFVLGTEYTYVANDLTEGEHKVGIKLFDETNNIETPVVNKEFSVIDFNIPSEAMEISEFQSTDAYIFNNSFRLNNGSVKNELGSNILYSVINNADHPYKDNSVYSMILRQPLILSAENDTFIYEDVAIVEPFTDDLTDLSQFFDYVIIEASTDLKNWVELDKYDARRFPEWIEEYNKDVNTSVTDNLFKEQSIAISSKGFSYGDTVVFRFSLITDPAANSYGWAIKSINSAPTSSVDDVLTGLTSFTVYPTISNGNFTVFAKSKTGKSKLNIFDIAGKEVYKTQLNFNSIEKQKLSINVNAGVYFVKLTAEDGKISTQKIIIE